MRDPREAAIEAAARAECERSWRANCVMQWRDWATYDPNLKAEWRTRVTPIVDAVLALGCEHREGICGDRGPDLPPGSTPRGVCVLRAGHAGWHHGHDDSDWTHGDKRSCDCAERLEAEAERMGDYHPQDEFRMAARFLRGDALWRIDRPESEPDLDAYREAEVAEFARARGHDLPLAERAARVDRALRDQSNPAGVNVTTPGPAVPGSSEGRPMTGAPLDADEAVPAPAGSPAEDGANDSRGIPPEPPSDARGSDLRALEGGEAVGEGRESAGPGGAQAAVCHWCDQAMARGVSCTLTTYDDFLDGVTRARTPLEEDYHSPACRDCNAPLGGLHHPGCHNERCPLCGFQAISLRLYGRGRRGRPAMTCDYSDLPTDQCDHCAHGIERQARRKGEVLARIEARYGGRCSACGDDFPEGEPIVLTTTSEGFWLHEGCA